MICWPKNVSQARLTYPLYLKSNSPELYQQLIVNQDSEILDQINEKPIEIYRCEELNSSVKNKVKISDSEETSEGS